MFNDAVKKIVTPFLTTVLLLLAPQICSVLALHCTADDVDVIEQLAGGGTAHGCIKEDTYVK